MADHIESSDGNLIARIDNGSASSARKFMVDHDGGGAGNELFEVLESGVVVLHGKIYRDAAVQFNNNQTGDIIDFMTNGTTVATIHGTGIGNFSTGGVLLRVLGSLTDAGNNQDIALFDPGSGDLMLYVYDGSYGTPWRALTNA